MGLRLICLWPFICFLLVSFCFVRAVAADDDARKTPPPCAVKNGGNISATTPSTPPPPTLSLPPAVNSDNFSPFRPSIAVIVGVLTTMFSITFLLLLYAKHCKRGNGVVGYGGTANSRGVPSSSTARKNSGIDRSVIESLPIFRFGSLRGQKDGLECAVCLNRFETTEVLRLLPKCKHAFHVECVDTWLDAHSTCPLCRYRVDPEDILLVEDGKIVHENEPLPSTPLEQDDPLDTTECRRSGTESESRTREESNPGPRPFSGRHSSAGEKGSGSLQIVLERPGVSESYNPTSSRRSLDSWSLRRKNETVDVGCFDRHRKDGLLLSDDKASFERRFEHRIIVSAGSGGFHQRWSDVQPSDLLYLRSEMIISDSRRYSSASGSRLSVSSKSRQQRQNQNQQLPLHLNRKGEMTQGGSGSEGIDGNRWSGRGVINLRCVSEITGLSRFSNRMSNYTLQQRQRQAGVVSRWSAWISQSRPDVR
ncbi:hypothetical protein L1049_022912 [Liquidambar formosana]|uniref:RING-type E3 ubiquitin transferase n=1 Tax=Liquidambar formosana TaxID=63359 RepID=A0AAP0REP1_LIQFO